MTLIIAAGCGSDPNPVVLEPPAGQAKGRPSAAAAAGPDANENVGEAKQNVPDAEGKVPDVEDDPPDPTTTPTGTEPSTEGEAPTLELAYPEDAYPLVWVRRGAEVVVRSEPGGGRVVEVVGKRTEFSSPTVYSVVKQAGRWVGISTPALPNGSLGWVRLDPGELKAGWTRVAVEVDLSQRRAALHEGDKIVRTFAVTIGAPGSDTPTGRFGVTDTFRGDLNEAAYGCCALALSATQPNLPSGWLGGNRIAIHGTSGPLGIAASHGCVRAANEDVDELVDRVPLGAPVFIRA